MRPPFTSLRLLVCRPHLLFFSPLRISPSQFVLQAKMSSSAYKGATPSDLNVDPRIVPFFERFYAVSDDPNAHEEYAQSFVPDADFTMGAKKTAGYKGILELRHGLWSGPIKTRKHTLHKIFPFGATSEGSKELMLYGNVDYGLKNGKAVTCEWAARAVMAEYEGGLRFKLYQVYVVSFCNSSTTWRAYG